MRTITPLLLTVLAFSPLYARGGGNMSPTTPKHTEKQHHFFEEVPPEVNSPASITPSKGLYMDIDLLVWQIRDTAIAYAFTGFGGSESVTEQGGMQTVPNRWRPGFKLGIGAFLPHDAWHISALYTYYRNNEASNSTNSTLYPLWNIGNNFQDSINSGEIVSAGGRVRYEYNTIDFELGKDYFVSNFLKLAPAIGFKAAWNKEQFTVNYGHPLDNDLEEQLQMQNNQNYYGFGLRTALHSEWFFDTMLSLKADVAYSLLSCRYQVSRRDSESLMPTQYSSELVTVNTQNSFFTANAVYELSLGPRFQWWLYKDKYHLSVAGAWEIQYWPNQNQLFSTDFNGVNGDLSLTGFTFSIDCLF